MRPKRPRATALPCCKQNLDLVQCSDKAEFIARFREIAQWFGLLSKEAMRESTFLVDKLVHRF